MSVGDLTGLLAPKFSCDLFDSVLSPISPEPEEEEAETENDIEGADEDDDEDEEYAASVEIPAAAGNATSARGIAWFIMKKDGELVYNIRWAKNQLHLLFVRTFGNGDHDFVPDWILFPLP